MPSKRLLFATSIPALVVALAIPTFWSQVSAQAPTGPRFSKNQELPLPLTSGTLPLKFIVRGLEPGVDVDVQGAIYTNSIRGVPGGFDMHRWSPLVDGPPNADGTLPFKYLGQPDNCGMLAVGCDTVGVAEGGGDAEVATGYPSTPGAIPNLAVTSQTLVPGESSMFSADRGDHFSIVNATSNPLVGEDREWMDAIGEKTVYMAVHDAGTFNIDVFRSTDGGFTYLAGYGQGIDPQTYPAAGGIPPSNTANVAGAFRIDKSSCNSRGNLYTIFVAPDSAVENLAGQTFRSVYVGVSTDAKLGLPVYTFTDHKIYTGPVGQSQENLFPALAVDNTGTLYAVWSNNADILIARSTDQGNTWTAPLRVNQAETVGRTNVMPWVDADANGHVGVVWFGADRIGNSNDTNVLAPCATDVLGNFTDGSCMKNWANWSVYYAETVNGRDPLPIFSQAKASDHVNHRGTISTGGLTGNANRDMGDFFQVAFDPQHRANVVFGDDSEVSPLNPTDPPDDPNTSRHIRANFTRQTNTAPGIVTAQACGPQVSEAGRKLNANGEIGAAKLGMVAKDTPTNGALAYDDGGISLRSSNGPSSVSFSTNCATISGAAKNNGNLGYNYTATACDNGEPGAGQDNFTIQVSGPGGYSYQRSGTLTKGNVTKN